MSRARMNGALAGAILIASIAAGCGASGGHTAAESAPVSSPAAAAGTPAPGAAAAPATPGASSVLSTYPAEDPKAAKIRSYDEFSVLRAGSVFVPPTSVQQAETPASTTPDATGPVTSTTSVGSTGTSGTTTGTGSTAGTAEPTRTQSVNIAQADVNGEKQVLKAGDKVPATDPVFTVDSISGTNVKLKLISGSFPGGSQTMDIAAGASVTLSNPASGKAIAILVRSITPVAV